jgi:hypothetical protein
MLGVLFAFNFCYPWFVLPLVLSVGQNAFFCFFGFYVSVKKTEKAKTMRLS